MSKRLNLFFFVCIACIYVHAQISSSDSLKLRRILESDGELKLNINAVKQIDFGSFINPPLQQAESSVLDYNLKLPNPITSPQKMILTLMPYTANTKFNYDPIYKHKIKVVKDTWKKDTLAHIYSITHYSNWAKTPMEGGDRKSVEEIEATGLRYNPIAERANNQPVGAWKRTSRPSGMDFMTPFTHEFWDFKGKKRRRRTLEILETYGDPLTTGGKKGTQPNDSIQ